MCVGERERDNFQETKSATQKQCKVVCNSLDESHEQPKFSSASAANFLSLHNCSTSNEIFSRTFSSKYLSLILSLTTFKQTCDLSSYIVNKRSEPFKNNLNVLIMQCALVDQCSKTQLLLPIFLQFSTSYISVINGKIQHSLYTERLYKYGFFSLQSTFFY